MRNFSAQSAAWSLICLIGVWTAPSVSTDYASTLQGDDRLQALFKCSPSLPTALADGRYTLKLTGLNAEQRFLPEGGLSLSDALGEADLASIAASHLQRRLLRESLPAGRVTPSAVHLFADQKTPNTLVFARDGQVTVFPRALLLWPYVSQIRIRHGDFIGSFHIEPKLGFETPLENADPLQALEPNRTLGNSAQASDIAIVIRGALPRSELGRRTIPPLPLSRFLEDRKAGGAQLEALVPLANSVAVIVLERSVQGLNVRYVCPMRTTGLMGQQGSLTKALFPVVNAEPATQQAIERNRWNQLFGNKLNSALLEDGDQLVFTQIESVL